MEKKKVTKMMQKLPQKMLLKLPKQTLQELPKQMLQARERLIKCTREGLYSLNRRISDQIVIRLHKFSQKRSKVASPILKEEISREDMLKIIKNARFEWANANENIEYVNEKDVIDYYAYVIKAHQLRYEYLIKQAKEMGIKTNNIDRYNIYPI